MRPVAHAVAGRFFLSMPSSPTRPKSETLLPPAPPARDVHVHGRDEFTDEFVTNDGYSPFAHIRTLGPNAYNITDVTRFVRPEELTRMSRDPKIHKSKRIIVHGTLTDDFQFATGATETEAGSSANFSKFVDVMQFCERLVGGLDRPYWVTLEMMLVGALEQGHKIAETVWEYRLDQPTRSLSTNAKKRGAATPSGSLLTRLFSRRPKAQDPADEDPNAPTTPNRFARRGTVRLMPRAIKVKKHGAALFVVDDYDNELGIVPAYAGQQSWTAGEVVSRDKFIVLTLNPEDSDPRGNSSWRPAYSYWKLVGHIPKAYLQLLLQEGMPIPVLTLPDRQDGWLTVRDAKGKPVPDPINPGRYKLQTVAEAAEKTLEKMFLGQGIAIPFGSALKPYREGGQNVGQVFENAIKVIYNIIEESILLQPLAQSAGDVQSKSAAMIHADVLGDAFFWYKRACAVMTLYDLCSVGVRINLGDWALPFMPKLSLGDSEKRDWARDLEVLAKAYWYGFIDETMRAELMAWLGLPKPGPAQQAQQPQPGQAQSDANGEPVPPAGQRPDKQGKQPTQSTDALMRERFEEVTRSVTAYESHAHTVGHHTRRRSSFVGYLPGRALAQGTGYRPDPR